jgi:hypothetical protein
VSPDYLLVLPDYVFVLPDYLLVFRDYRLAPGAYCLASDDLTQSISTNCEPAGALRRVSPE